MTVAEAEAAVESAREDLSAAEHAYDVALRAQHDARTALNRAQWELIKARAVVTRAQLPVPVWVTPPWLALLRVAEVESYRIVLVDESGFRRDYSRETGFLRYARGKRKTDYGQLDVAATLAVWGGR